MDKDMNKIFNWSGDLDLIFFHKLIFIAITLSESAHPGF